MPTDVEGLIERNGRFLLLETKADFVPIPIGQRRTHEALRKLGVFEICYVWGEAETGTVHKMRVDTAEGIGKSAPATTADLRAYVSDWFQRADQVKELEDLWR